jgi:xanthine dehydrogenase YagR molybdenum-binding subunit
MPEAPDAGGSQLTASVSNAVHLPPESLREKIAGLALADPASPLHGRQPRRPRLRDGRVFVRSNPDGGETYAAILRRAGQPS